MICIFSSVLHAFLFMTSLTGVGVKPDLQAQVRTAEQAFAKTMKDRDHAAFVSFIAVDAVFLTKVGSLKGRQAVADGWKPYFTAPSVPFSWEPERVEVAVSGRLAISTGPVRNPQGLRTGTYVSTWRLESDGQWRVVLDTACPACDCDRGTVRGKF